MSKKYYVVWKGAKTGVFKTWAEVQAHTHGRSDAQFMGFPSQQEAELAFKSTYTKALMQRSLSKSNTSNKPNKSVSASTPYASASQRALPTSTTIDIYCDGACSPNPGKAGTGIAVYQKAKLTSLWYGLYEANGTNNSAELNGMLEAFKLAETFIQQHQPVQILSDSRYSIDCITKWAKGWKSKGWTRGKGEEVKNLALVQQCYDLYEKLKAHLTITHVKGHANIEGNELADRMAVYARTNKQPRFVQYENSLDIAQILAMPSG